VGAVGAVGGVAESIKQKLRQLLTPLLRSTLVVWVLFFASAFSYYGLVLLTTQLAQSASDPGSGAPGRQSHCPDMGYTPAHSPAAGVGVHLCRGGVHPWPALRQLPHPWGHLCYALPEQL